ncbi:MAG: helix-turn-helix domain-containing protein [Planctomycetota bacterium]
MREDIEHLMQAFARRVRIVRETQGYSQQDLADALDASVPTISAYETGRRTPALPWIVRFAELMDVNLTYLIMGRLPDVERLASTESRFGAFTHTTARGEPALVYICPVCKRPVSREGQDHCPYCGFVFDWEGENTSDRD